MRKVAALALAITGPVLSGCSSSTDAELDPRILEVPAVACPADTPTLDQCMRRGFEIDPAEGDSSFHFTVMIPLFQNPPDPAWRIVSIFINGELTSYDVEELDGPIDPPTRTTQDTLIFPWFNPTHPTLTIEITMAEGADIRFIRPIADTSFLWVQKRRPAPPVAN